MKRSCLPALLAALLLYSFPGHGQDTYVRPIGELRHALQKEHSEAKRARLLLDLSVAYVIRPGEAAGDLDSAFLLLHQAEAINNSLQDPFVKARTHYAYSCALRESGKKTEGKEHIGKAIDGYAALAPSARLELGEAYIESARYLNFDIIKERDEEKNCFVLALEQFRMDKLQERTAYACKSLGDLEELSGNDDKARLYRREALGLYLGLHLKPIECIQLTLKICPLNYPPPPPKTNEPDTAYHKRDDLARGLSWTQAMEIYHSLHDSIRIREAQSTIINGLVDVGQTEWFFRHPAMAEAIDVFAIEFGRTCQVVNTSAHFNACFANIFLGRLYTALGYGLEAVRMIEKNGNPQQDAMPYFAVGRVYYELGKWDESLQYIKRSILLQKARKKPVTSQYLNLGVKALLLSQRPKDALAFLEENVQSPMPTGYYRKAVQELYGECYLGMKEYARAEKYYLDIYNDSLVVDLSMKPMAGLGLASIYFQTGRYQLAPPFLQPILDNPNRAVVPLVEVIRAQLLMSQLDSAAGNYPSALQHLHTFRRLNDSLNSATKNRQIEDLKVQYETEKKDQNIQLLTKQGQLQASLLQQTRLAFEYENAQKRHELDLLALQAEKREHTLQLLSSETDRKGKDLLLKEKNIELLTKQGQLQAADLQHSRLLRNGFLIGAIMLVILLGLVCNRYLLKQKSNRVLLAQQEEISRSNQRLQLLNENQQKLIAEKEWLVKEVHHRVKNNLQIVISLLNIHSGYLKDELALSAFRDISARVRAISLIHQKLYRENDITTIHMPDYISEMVSFLKDSYTSGNRIRFTVNADPIDMDVALCVPVGLILNEAITNAIKYAFEDKVQGHITVSLLRTEDHDFELIIADNGRGLPAGFDLKNQDSMGFELIQTLALQLQGHIHVTNDHGLRILLQFPQEQKIPHFSAAANG